MLSLLFSFLKILVLNLGLPSSLEREEKVEMRKKWKEQNVGEATRTQAKSTLLYVTNPIQLTLTGKK